MTRICTHVLRICTHRPAWLACDTCHADFPHRHSCPGLGTPGCARDCMNGADPPHRARRPVRRPRLRREPSVTDTTEARRELLRILLDRAERGALLPAEHPLLRALVAAEQAAADRAAAAADTYAAADSADTAAGSYALRAEQAEERARQAEATLARVRDALNALGPLARFHMAMALGDPQPLRVFEGTTQRADAIAVYPTDGTPAEQQ